MIEKIVLDGLNQNGVSVKKQKYIVQNEVEYSIGEPWRRAYVNSEKDRQYIVAELPQAQVNAIMAIWGDTPTIIEEDE